ncbi:HigA family addiction module antitoxin [Magnetospirillum moscoviense]|uniref:Transcriptional regulator n=1 Tax=Magnetospirillum moscoviense TaxID=1437059 RepID=A0A178MWF8_9PROT|nr:HigA family addiction module antitoxin [Magnetospirillum moscoviense]OAN53803.1 transcriptional regulator [Magnetospirillum moscoviense]
MTYPAIDNLPPVHPGEILRDELDALSMSARKFAVHIQVPPNAVTAILNKERGISAKMALRLGQAFGTGPGYWMRLQDTYDEKCARAELAGTLDLITPLAGGEGGDPLTR